MGVAETVKKHFKGPKDEEIAAAEVVRSVSNADTDTAEGMTKHVPTTDVSGVSRVEATQAVWGKRGRYIIIAGLAMMMIVYELDNTTVYNYQAYATSSFNKVDMLATLATAGSIIFAVMKPPIAKISDVIGRGETYCITISFYLLAYILCASSKTINIYAAGYIFYSIGQTGTNIMNDIVISDITTMKWRGFAIGLSFFPFLIIPWCSAFIVDSVIGGIGWRWGIGMLAIIMPFAASFIIFALLYYQRKAKKAGLVVTQKMTIYKFCSLIDLGGSFLASAGFAMMLIPLTLADTTTSKWNTPWIPALIAVGGVVLVAIMPYEKWIAKHPILPPRYFTNLTIVCSFLVAAFDNMGFGATHTYLYSWSTIVHDLSPRNATFLNYTNGVWQCLVGIVCGLLMSRFRRYKWLAVIGACIRFIGYGVMLRLRGTNNSLAELFVVQSIQGWGSGFLTIITIVAAQIQVPHAEMAQITSLVLLFSFLGSAVGSSIAGGVDTSTFKDRLRHYLGVSATPGLVDTVFGSMVGDIPAPGTKDRIAIDYAYSDVLKNITYVALATSVLILIGTLMYPDLRLRDDHNLVQAHETFDEHARADVADGSDEKRIDVHGEAA